MMNNKKLTRSKDKMIGGVCGGVAEYLDIDPTVVRIVWACSIIFGGLGFWAYIICLIVMPQKSEQ